jgi:hypothetical protein
VISRLGTVGTWVVTLVTFSLVIEVSNLTWTGWWVNSVSTTNNTVVGELFARSTLAITNNDDGGTNWDIDDLSGLNDWFWFNTLWWLD